jgi:hypothetical protein
MDRQTRSIAGIALVLVAGLAVGGGVLFVNQDQGAVDPGTKAPLTKTQLKYRLIDRFGPLAYCDPDSYPVAVEGGEARNAKSWWQTTDRDGEQVTTIRAHLGLGGGDLTDQSVLRVYREYKVLSAGIPLFQSAGDRYRFSLRTGAGKGEETSIAGSIELNGKITVQKQERTTDPGCPICLGGDARIDTPAGPIRVAELREGMPAWTVDAAGHRVAGAVVRTIRRAIRASHPMIRLALADGRTVTASPGHPTLQGRLFAFLAAGDFVDGARIASITVTSSTEPFTYDVLMNGPTGAYWADGVLIGSTLARR